MIWLATVFAKSDKISQERVSTNSIQIDSISCNVYDANKLDTYMGKKIPSANSIMVPAKRIDDNH